MNGRLDT